MNRLDLETFYNTQDVKRFAFPGRLLWGKDVRFHVESLLADCDRIELYVDVFFDKHPFVRSLQENFGSRLLHREIVRCTPRIRAIEETAHARRPSADAIVAIGGGSTMDFAKAVIAKRLFGTFDGVGIREKRGIRPLPEAQKPLFVSLPTTAGTGAEASRYYVTYDDETHAKCHGKSWRLIADWILLDAEFICSSPDALIVASAYDAFVHFFESFVCRNEASWFGEMLSIDGIARILRSLDLLINGGRRDRKLYLELLYAATIGGVAISNVRTGNIHEAAGALLERSSLTHPETLFVFFRTAYDQYHMKIRDKEAVLMSRLKEAGLSREMNGIRDVILLWEGFFQKTGLLEHIQKEMSILREDWEGIRNHIFQRVWEDRVWCEKESPVPLSEEMVWNFIDHSVEAYFF